MPTTKDISSSMFTKRLLSLGKALAITLISLNFSFISSSLMRARSLLVKTICLSLVIRPTSLAIDVAVSIASPVIIIV